MVKASTLINAALFLTSVGVLVAAAFLGTDLPVQLEHALYVALGIALPQLGGLAKGKAQAKHQVIHPSGFNLTKGEEKLLKEMFEALDKEGKAK